MKSKDQDYFLFPLLRETYHDTVFHCIPLDTRTTSQAGESRRHPHHGKCRHSHRGWDDTARFLKSKDLSVA